MKKRLTMFLAALFLCMGTAMAQTKVSGTVFSQEDGQPIIGAAVKVDGTSTGMLTDVNGRFSLTLPAGKNTITVSYLGYESKTVQAKNGMRVFLKSDATALDEVVVTAMGISRQQKTLGYSAQTLDDAELTTGKLTDVTGALAGKVAGLQINTTSSDPGQASSVIIRGISSINGNNQPLYVVDGVPLQTTTFRTMGHVQAMGGLSSINPNDIESMTVLKGAAATALSGSRAANGVIVITTKSRVSVTSRSPTTEAYSGVTSARCRRCRTSSDRVGTVPRPSSRTVLGVLSSMVVPRFTVLSGTTSS